jgi:ribA/ribD-fused uncharacterized protein
MSTVNALSDREKKPNTLERKLERSSTVADRPCKCKYEGSQEIKSSSRTSNPRVNVALIKGVSCIPEDDLTKLKPMLGTDKDTVVNAKGVYFWRLKCIFSQWHRASFKGPDGALYSNTEQWMMAGKARVFNDTGTLSKIMKTSDPKKIWALGRKVANFDGRTWDKHKRHVVLQGNLLKFSQNREFARAILATGDRVLVEASPWDKIWGIGMNAASACRVPESDWKGLNLLGNALMDVRSILRDALLKA